jgi:hypothetical protein
MKLHYILIITLIVMLLFGIVQGDFTETWLNGATL